MSDNISLGKKAGNIDFTKIKSGIKKQELAGKDKNLESIFDSVDENKNGVLDRGELQNFHQKIAELAGKNAELSNREAKKYRDLDGNKLAPELRGGGSKLLLVSFPD